MTRALTLQPIHLAVAREFVAAHHHIKGFATLPRRGGCGASGVVASPKT